MYEEISCPCDTVILDGFRSRREDLFASIRRRQYYLYGGRYKLRTINIFKLTSIAIDID